MTSAATHVRIPVTPAARESLAVHVNGRPLPSAEDTRIGPMIEREEAYRRADVVIDAGWAPVNHPMPGPNIREQIARVISGSPTPSKRSYTRADEILTLLQGRA